MHILGTDFVALKWPLILAGEKATLPRLTVCLAGMDAAVENLVRDLDGFSSSSISMHSTWWATVCASCERDGSAFSSLMMETRVRLFTREVIEDGSWSSGQNLQWQVQWQVQWQLRRWGLPVVASAALALLPSTVEAIVKTCRGVLAASTRRHSLFYERVDAWEGARV